MELSTMVTTSMTVDATVITYPQKLLALSRSLIDQQKEYGTAILVAHVACEVATDRTLTDAFKNRGIPDLEDAVTRLLSGNNLGNERIRRLYTALTGDDVANAPFWQKFTESAKRRNNIAHKGALASEAEAEDSYAAARDLVNHLGK
jgi:hypothetical protein